MRGIVASGLVAGMLLCLLPSFLPRNAGSAQATENPVAGYLTVWYRYGSTNYDYDVWFLDSAWHKSNTGWDGCYTEEGSKFDHMHSDSGFPFDDGYHHNPPLPVTATMCNDYYDTVFGQGFSRISGATCSYNCHGYVTSRFNCIKSGMDGMIEIVDDEYDVVTMDEEPIEGGAIYTNGDHSVHVTLYGCNAPDEELIGKVWKWNEKQDASGIYYKNYYPEAGPPGPGVLCRLDFD